MFKWNFIVDMYLHTVQLTSRAPLASQGALQQQLAGDVNGVSVTASCDKHPT